MALKVLIPTPIQSSSAKPEATPPPFDPESFFLKARGIWSILFFSLPIDILLILLPLGSLPLPVRAESLDTWIYLALALSFLFIIRQELLDGLLWVRKQSGANASKVKGQSVIIPAIIAFVTIAKLVSKLGGFGYLPLILLGLFLIWPLYRAYSKELKSIKEHKEKLIEDINFYNASMEVEALLFFALPISFGRAVSTLGALKIGLAGGGLADYLPYLLASFLLLAASVPKREDYMRSCGRCKAWISSAYGSNTLCHSCRALLKPKEPNKTAVVSKKTDDLQAKLPKTKKVDEPTKLMILPMAKKE